MPMSATSAAAMAGGIRQNQDLEPAFPPADAPCLFELLRALREFGTLGKAAAGSSIS